MLTERLRNDLVLAATDIADDNERADRALLVATRLRRQRLRRRAVIVASVGVCAAIAPLAMPRHAAVPPANAAVVTCLPGRTVVSTPRVVPMPDGAVVAIANRTQGSVVVRVGNQIAVIAPGTAEGQYLLRPGRQPVQCVTDARPTPVASFDVLPVRPA